MNTDKKIEIEPIWGCFEGSRIVYDQDKEALCLQLGEGKYWIEGSKTSEPISIEVDSEGWVVISKDNK